MKKLVSYTLLLFYFMGCSPVQDQKTSHQGQDVYDVVKVIDGDTFIIQGGEHVRLIGIDAPETQNSYKQRNFHFGEEAKEYLTELLDGQEVTLEFDVEKKDRYKRLLAYAWLNDSVMVNALLIKKGFARAITYPPNVKHTDWFNQLEREAQKNNRGLWDKE